MPLHRSLCKLYQYADDPVMLSRHINYETCMQMLQKNSSSILDWFSSSLINLNVSKTSLVCFRNPLENVSLDFPLFLHRSNCTPCRCSPIRYTNNVKYFGIYFRNDITWKLKLSNLSKRL